jgi:hypothetical protein
MANATIVMGAMWGDEGMVFTLSSRLRLECLTYLYRQRKDD